MSFKPGFTFSSEPPCFNGQRFATEAEAEKSAQARFDRWTTPTGWFVEESDEPVNYRWDDAKGDVMLTSDKAE
jgi:hypothetical protein